MRRENTVFQAYLTAGKNTTQLNFPTSDEQLAHTKEVLGVENLSSVDVFGIQIGPGLDYLSEFLPMGVVTVEELDAMAACIQAMGQDREEMLKFCAVLDVERPSIFSEALNIAMDIDDYELVPENPEEYGRQILRQIGADDEIIDTIDGYTDFTKLGADAMMEDGVRQTNFGAVRRLSKPFPKPEIEQMMM